MDCHIRAICEDVTRDDHGNITLSRFFNILTVPQLPEGVRLHAYYAAFLEPDEEGQQIEVEFHMVHPEGAHDVLLQRQMMTPGRAFPGAPAGWAAWALVRAQFVSYGPHEFVLHIDGREIASTTLHVVKSHDAPSV